ncbi:MAG: SSS family solute:Na+ symporter [Desulforhopalus sp.]|jgi:SSS family solute:Na+ symporter
MEKLGTIDSTILVIFLFLSVLIGYVAAKRTKSSADFAVANRSLGTFITMATLAASMVGAFAVIAQAGFAYKNGISAYWFVVSWCAGWAVLAVISKRLRDTDALTLPDVFRKRFGDKAAALGGVITLIFVIGTLSSQLAATGLVLQILLAPYGVDFVTATIIGAILVAVYTIFGGLYAVVYNDAFHFITLFVGICIITPIVTGNTVPADFSFSGSFPAEMWDWSNGTTTMAIAGLFVSFMFTATSNPMLIQRTLAARTSRIASNAHWYSICWYLVVGLVVTLCAMAGRFILPGLENPEMYMPIFILTYMPVVFKGILIAALLSVLMSTIDSQLLVAGTTTSIDLFKTIRPNADDKSVLLVSRGSIIFWSIIGMLLALYFKSVLGLFAYATKIYGAAMFFPLLYTLYANKGYSTAMFAGMISGAVCSLTWAISGNPYGISPVIFGGTVSIVATLAGHLYGTKQASLNDTFDSQVSTEITS